MAERILPAPGTTPRPKLSWPPRARAASCCRTATTAVARIGIACGVPALLQRAPDVEAASGRGTVYAHSTMLRVEAPYTLAYVTLDEGPTMMTNLVGAAPEAWAHRHAGARALPGG